MSEIKVRFHNGWWQWYSALDRMWYGFYTSEAAARAGAVEEGPVQLAGD